jgi:hypothetical protein
MAKTAQSQRLLNRASDWLGSWFSSSPAAYDRCSITNGPGSYQPFCSDSESCQETVATCSGSNSKQQVHVGSSVVNFISGPGGNSTQVKEELLERAGSHVMGDLAAGVMMQSPLNGTEPLTGFVGSRNVSDGFGGLYQVTVQASSLSIQQSIDYNTAFLTIDLEPSLSPIVPGGGAGDLSNGGIGGIAAAAGFLAMFCGFLCRANAAGPRDDYEEIAEPRAAQQPVAQRPAAQQAGASETVVQP